MPCGHINPVCSFLDAETAGTETSGTGASGEWGILKIEKSGNRSPPPVWRGVANVQWPSAHLQFAFSNFQFSIFNLVPLFAAAPW